MYGEKKHFQGLNEGDQVGYEGGLEVKMPDAIYERGGKDDIKVLVRHEKHILDTL